MGIDSNVSGVGNLTNDSSRTSINGSSSIKTSISDAIIDATKTFVDRINEQIEEAKEKIELEADESVNDYLDPSTMTEEDWKRYQDKFDEVIRNSSSPKEAAANIAKFMAYEFPKLHYFWGGGHDIGSEEEFMGLNRNWGQDEKVVYGGSTGWAEGSYFPNSFDCSGFVTWVLLNAGINIGDYYSGYSPSSPCLNTTMINTMGDHYGFDNENLLDIIEPGDIAWQSSHTGVVVDVDKENHTITVVHISGSGQGTNVTTFDIPSGKIVADDIGEMPEFDNPYGMSNDGSSPYQEDSVRRGENASENFLFTEFIHLDKNE